MGVDPLISTVEHDAESRHGLLEKAHAIRDENDLIRALRLFRFKHIVF